MTLHLVSLTDKPAANQRINALDEAIQAWRIALGDENVSTRPEDLARAQSATFASTQHVPAWIRPQTTEEVRTCVLVAHRYRIPLYPISTGKNWGLGSRVPVRSGCVLMDLSRMTRILDFNEKLAHITVEPGVTFDQVHCFLRARGSRLFASVIGGSPQASLIGNALERGDGDGPLGDRAGHVNGLEVVLANGEVINTGFERFHNARAARVHPYGVGPALDQLFFQSNFGIVTRMTFALARHPKHVWAWNAQVHRLAALPAWLDAMQELILEGIMEPNALTLWNDAKLQARQGISSVQGNTDGWHGCGVVSGPTPSIAVGLRDLVVTRLKTCADDVLFSEIHGPFLGEPSTENLRTVYQHKTQGVPAEIDPDRDHCGVLWLCFAIPFDGAQVANAMDIANRVCAHHDFAPHIGMSASSPRNIIAYLTLVYDRDAPGDDNRAMTCHDALLSRLIERGHYPYRLGIQSMRALPPSLGAYDRTLSGLKQWLDPLGILAPGRYVREPDQ